jgi:hypothetical protein
LRTPTSTELRRSSTRASSNRRATGSRCWRPSASTRPRASRRAPGGGAAASACRLLPRPGRAPAAGAARRLRPRFARAAGRRPRQLRRGARGVRRCTGDAASPRRRAVAALARARLSQRGARMGRGGVARCAE